MKKSRNYTWLVLGIITIILGLILPFVLMNQSMYYECDCITDSQHTNNKTFTITIYSKEKISNIQNVVITFDCIDNEKREQEVNFVTSSKEKGKYVYEVQCLTTHSFIEEVDEIEVITNTGAITISEKIQTSTKISIAVFISIVGGFMIFVNFFNNNAKNRTIELKRMVSASNTNSTSLNHANLSILQNLNSETQSANETKICAYCGTVAEEGDKVCSSCGARLK